MSWCSAGSSRFPITKRYRQQAPCPRLEERGMPQNFGGKDTLIRNARLIDGTGAPWFEADLRISGSRIAAIGAALPADGADIIEAGGCYLAPGFIDAHCHDDLICLREPDRPEKVLQGVTTLVVGNCCFSL